MKLDEVVSIFKEAKLPFTYYKWGTNNVPLLPYIVYYYPSSDDEFADDINWSNVKQLNIELYSANKNFELEDKLEQIFEQKDLCFLKSESYLEDENMYEVLYEMEVIIDG